MGCSGASVISSPRETKLDNKMENVKNEELNKKFKEAELCLNELEIIRSSLVDKRDELIYNTGACCRKDPNLEKIIMSFLWILGVNSKGNFSKYQLYFNQGQDPYFSIVYKEDEEKKISEDINDYIKNLFDFEDSIKTNTEHYNNILSDFNNNEIKYRELVTGSDLQIYQRNIVKIRKISQINLINIIKDIYSVDMDFIDKFPEEMGNDNFIKEINSIGLKSAENGYKDKYEIVFYNSNSEDRYMNSPKDGKNLYQNKIGHKRKK